MTNINEIVGKQIVETENWISTSWSMYLSTGKENFSEDTKRYKRQLSVLLAIQAVVELIQKKQKFLENTGGDIPMTNQQLGAREERTKLLAEIKQAIEKELE